MSEAIQTFKFSRKKLLDAYAAMAASTGQDYIATTKPVHSVQSLQGDVVDVDGTNGKAYVLFRKRQQMVFFEPQQGQAGPLAGDPNHKFSEADTNLTKSRSTPGAADMAIEGIGFALRSQKIAYASKTGLGAPATPEVIAALSGTGAIFDPGSLVIPQELQSPAMLEETVFHALAPYLSVAFEWDQAERTEKIGAADQLSQGGGNSYLRANGVPSPRDKFTVPEGYIWTRDGQPGCEFVVRMTLTDDVVIPVTLVTEFDDVGYVTPSAVYAEFITRLYGLQLRLPNKN